MFWSLEEWQGKKGGKKDKKEKRTGMCVEEKFSGKKKGKKKRRRKKCRVEDKKRVEKKKKGKKNNEILSQFFHNKF